MVNCYLDRELIYDFMSDLENALIYESELEKVNNKFSKVISGDKTVAKAFFEKFNFVKKQLNNDLKFFIESDPACDGEDEVILCYPGFRAIVYYRIANILYLLNFKLIARIISERAHVLTGIDIHPGATIGCPFFIDHGTGIVIGETTVIGNYVKLYQGVTLGALSLKKGSKMRGEKRHPTIGNNVTIYANAAILGGKVNIGNNVVIGGNVFLTESIPDNYKVIIHKPELVLIKKVASKKK